MIDSALSFVKQVLNQQLKNQFGLEADTVIANHLVEANGNPPLANQNKMVLTLINLESETNKQFYGGNRGVQGSNIQQLQPAARFNLDILLTASFDVYNEALKFLSATIAFFQANPTLTKQLFPTMPDSARIANRAGTAHDQNAMFVNLQRRIINPRVEILWPVKNDRATLKRVRIAVHFQIPRAEFVTNHRGFHDRTVKQIALEVNEACRANQ